MSSGTGNLVGTADARGCAENLEYDGLGRVTGEDYSPCEPGQPVYTPALEATYTYDQPEPGQTDDYGPNPASLAGHLAALTPSDPTTLTGRRGHSSRRRWGAAYWADQPGLAPWIPGAAQ